MWPRVPMYVLATTIALMAGSPVASAKSSDFYVKEARQYLDKGETKAAVIQLKNALQEDPSDVQARLMLGSLHLENGDGAAAAKEFGRARDLGADRQSWILGYARALMLQGKRQALLQEVGVDPALPAPMRAELHALRGNANLALRETEAAVVEYDAALGLEPDNAMARLGKARILLAEGREAEALGELDRIVAEHPDHVDSRMFRGDLLRRQRRLDEAAADYERAAQVAPNNPRAHIGLALVHIAQRDRESAQKDLATLHQLAPGVPAVGYLQALVSFQEGDQERASDELQNVLRVAPANFQAQLLYGIVSYARGEYTIADDYLTRVLASAPGNAQIAKILGATRLKLGQPERAAQVLSTVVDDATGDPQLLALLGTAYLQAGDNTKGAEYIEKAVELDPDQALLRTQLAVGRIATGDTTAAISELESAVALGQDVLQADVLLVLSYINRREFDKAVTAAEALETRMPDSPIPYNLSGLAYLSQREFESADKKFEQALEKDPQFLVAYMNQARLALMAGQPAAAAGAYQEVLEQDPKHVAAMLGMAGLAGADQDMAGAEEWLQRANRADPAALKPMLALAEIYLRQNDGLKALGILSGMSPQQAELPVALRVKGMAQLQSGDYASAMHTLRILTERQPESIEGWFQLARAQSAAGDTAAARSSYDRAIALDSDHKVPVVWIGRGELELHERRYDEALVVAQQIKTNFPDSVYGYDMEAAAYRGKGEPDAALAALEEALQIESSPLRLNTFASTLAASGQVERAVELLEDWLGQHPDDGLVWANLGMLRQRLGRDEAALEAYEKSLQTTAANAVILNNMAWLYLDRDDERAVELATQAYRLAPSRAEIVDTYGWILLRQGRSSEGLAALQQALVIAPQNAEIALHVAEALHVLDRDNEARPILLRVLRDNPDTEFADSARTLLGKLRG
jgi:putative PEP-CTERM system TPR-repeat lipoprotein